jgi:GxxExxY protein
MSVSTHIQFGSLPEGDFKDLDYRVMAHAFASHNDLGRLCDEGIYRADLAVRLADAGIGPVSKQVPVSIRFRGFSKTYFIDLVVQDSIIYEIKAVAAIVGEHTAQLLNYLLILDLPRGKLLNYRPPQLERRYVSTRLTAESRRRFELRDERWKRMGTACAFVRETLPQILTEWGTFLDIGLYLEALTFLLGGEHQIRRRIELFQHGCLLGTQRCHLLTPDVALRLTAFTDYLDRFEYDLRRFLDHTNLNAIQWVNLNHNKVEFVTLTR